MKVATVCGGGEGVWEELDRTNALLGRALNGADEWVALAVNEAGIFHPDPLHHWCTGHPEKLDRWKGARTTIGNSLPATWSSREADNVIRRTWRNGSSGLLGIDVALHHLGVDAVVLCGIPMDDRRNQFRGTRWNAWASSWRAWEEVGTALIGPVRSWSGRTRMMLGEPTPEWLEGRRP